MIGRRPVGWGLVIFDCDGVLVDSEPVANRIFHEQLRAVGVPMSLEEVLREFVGLSLAACFEKIERRLGRPLPDDFETRLQARTYEAFRDGLDPIAGVHEVLERIGAELPICVASSGSHEKLRLTLGLTGLLPRFDGLIFSAAEVERGKPAPDLFLHAARKLGVPPGRCAVIEDSLPGVQAARAAGMHAFGYVERSDPAALAGAGATVFRKMGDLPRLLFEHAPADLPGESEWPPG